MNRARKWLRRAGRAARISLMVAAVLLVASADDARTTITVAACVAVFLAVAVTAHRYARGQAAGERDERDGDLS